MKAKKSELPDYPPFLTIAMIADLLHVCSRTVARWIEEGRIRSIKTVPGGSGRVLVRREELIRFLADGESTNASSSPTKS